MNEYFEEIKGDKYLMLVSTNESKEEKLKKHEELWIKTRLLMRSRTKNSDDYDEKYMKIKFNLYNELLLNKTIEIITMTMVVSMFFMKTANIIHKFFETNV